MTASKSIPLSSFNETHSFPAEWKQGVYAAINRRRDMRSFLPDPVPDELLGRVIWAALHAPSVGYMQPWDFIIIRGREIRERLWRHVDGERRAAAAGFPEGARRDQYLTFKLEGIRDAPVNMLITCDTSRSGPAVIGRNTIREMDTYSVVCAVQNLWLAARAEGLGVGWVSILRNETLRELFNLPEHVIPVAYLCVGWVKDFPHQPLLKTIGWLPEMELEQVVHAETWGARPPLEVVDGLKAGARELTEE